MRCLIFVEPASCECYIVVRISVVCALCVVCPPGFFQAITSAFMHGFQNNMAQLFSLMSRSAT